MTIGSVGTDQAVIENPFFLYLSREGILTRNANSVRSEALAVSHGKGITKGHVSHRKHAQFHEPFGPQFQGRTGGRIRIQ